ncbi:MAG TPA: UdgX family uracil-DNA binding protein [Tepidisphaeraceae bacterium]|nr:UdgX family uracil-DNA binding protein [Tepidisphaeraceae bacterium]
MLILVPLMHVIPITPTFDAWRTAARALLARNVPPADVWFEDASADTASFFAVNNVELPNEPTGCGTPESSKSTVPKEFLSLAKLVACHRDPARWALLYRALYRLTHGQPYLLELESDDDVRQLAQMAKAVSRDRHKMTAFVRFRKVDDAGREHYVAYHHPDHLILRLTAPFFVKRFGSMAWSILTPDECAHWDGRDLTFSPGVDPSLAPQQDDLEQLWGDYYRNIFNPARIKLAAMKKEMPVRYWKHLPETRLIPDMLKDAPARVEDMMSKKLDEYPSAEAFMPAKITLPALQKAAAGCHGCPLYKIGTQTVFGEGREDARIVFVGEQPGDQEDRAGKPFVGPAGQVLDQALEEVGIDRSICYVTNAVKHFKWEPRGTRRIHAKPGAREIQACKPWLTAELQVLQPQMVVCLGATAAQALMGKEFRITRSRGQVFKDTQWAPWLTATVHPSSILRTPEEDRDAAYKAFVADLSVVAKALKHHGPRRKSDTQLTRPPGSDGGAQPGLFDAPAPAKSRKRSRS